LVQSTFGLVQGNFLCASYESIFLGLRRAPSSGDLIIHLRLLHRRSVPSHAQSLPLCRVPIITLLLFSPSSVADSIVVISWGDTPYPHLHSSTSVTRPTILPGPFHHGGYVASFIIYPPLHRGYPLILWGVFHRSPLLLLPATITFFYLLSPRHQ